MITENQLKEYKFGHLSNGIMRLYAGNFEFTYYPDAKIMHLGMEEGNGWHEVKDFAEFETLYYIFTN